MSRCELPTLEVSGNQNMATLPPILKRIVRPGKKLSQRTIHATFWASATRIGNVLILIRTLVLARMLAPSEFGVMAIALTILAFVDLTKTGFRVALIQRQGDIRPYLDAAWTLEVLRGLVLAGAMVLAAPLLAGFLRVPEAERVIQVLAITVVMRGFINVGVVYFRKDLELHKRFLFQMARVIVAAGVSIVLAFVLKSVWAFVYGALAGSATLVVVSYLLHPYRPRPRFDWSKMKELWDFSRWVLGTHILVYLLRYVDRLFIGRMLGVASMGYYQLGFRLSQYVGLQLRFIGADVALPLYATLQDQREKLRDAYLLGMQFTALVSFPVAIGIMVAGSHFVPVILGEKWLPIVPIMQVLAIAGLLSGIEAVGSNQLFPAIGRPHLTTRLQLIRLGLLLAMVYPLTATFGLVGTGLALTLSAALIFPVSLKLAQSALDCTLISQLRVLIVPTVSSLIMAAALIAAKMGPASEPTFFSTMWLLALGAVVYLAAVFVLDRILGQGIMRLIRRRLGYQSAD